MGDEHRNGNIKKTLKHLNKTYREPQPYPQ